MVAVFLPFRKLIQNIFITISKSSFPPSKNKYINKIEQLEKKKFVTFFKN